MIGNIRLFIIGMIFFCIYIPTNITLIQMKKETKVTDVSLSGIWNLPPTALLAISGEFKGMMANYITLEAGAQLGTQLVRKKEGGFKVVRREHNWKNIHRLFLASQSLDPTFAQTYILLQGHLPWEPVNMVAETQDFLEVTIKNRPWDWQPYQAMAFNSYYFLNDPGKAGKIFLEASSLPSAPSFLAILGSRLAQKGGETIAAIALMKSMLSGKTPNDRGYERMVQRLQALEGTLVLEEAVHKFKQSKGRAPFSLNELIRAGYLAQIPKNPYELEYCIDYAGNVFFDRPHCNLMFIKPLDSPLE